MTIPKSKRVWSVSDAQANLAEVLRLAETEGPQYIEAAATFVVTPAEPEPEQTHQEERMPLGQWLVENMPRGTNLEVPRDRRSNRKTPFIDEGSE